MAQHGALRAHLRDEAAEYLPKPRSFTVLCARKGHVSWYDAGGCEHVLPGMRFLRKFMAELKVELKNAPYCSIAENYLSKRL
jgi:hypothetical protein